MLNYTTEMQTANYRLGNYRNNDPVFSGGKNKQTNRTQKRKNCWGVQKGNGKEALNLKILKRLKDMPTNCNEYTLCAP